MSKIKSVQAYEILASGGLPTIECTVITEDGHKGVASVSYGASAGSHEAAVLSDGDTARYGGKGVLQMCKTIEQVIAQQIIGMDVTEQEQIDRLMIGLDGTERKEKLGGNTILAVSMAVARAASVATGVELYAYLANTFDMPAPKALPKPMVVTIEGGAHADNSTDLQEYLLTVTYSDSARENIRVVSEIYQAAKKILKSKGWSVNVGNEGAFAPEGITDNQLPLDMLQEAITKAGYAPGKDAWLSLDVAASEFFKNGVYHFDRGDRDLTADDLLTWYTHLVETYPIYSIEDGFHEDAWPEWTKQMTALGDKVKIIGDDLTVTNKERLEKAIQEKAMNGILVKLNQAGTVTETMLTCKRAKQEGYLVVPSHRGGGESNDTFLVDLAVAVGGDFIKVGIARGERVAKYNRLMEIERILQN